MHVGRVVTLLDIGHFVVVVTVIAVTPLYERTGAFEDRFRKSRRLVNDATVDKEARVVRIVHFPHIANPHRGL